MQEKSCSFLFLYDKWDSNEFHWLKMDVRRGRGYLILAVSPVIGFSVVADDVVIIISSSMRKEPESEEKNLHENTLFCCGINSSGSNSSFWVAEKSFSPFTSLFQLAHHRHGPTEMNETYEMKEY